MASSEGNYHRRGPYFDGTNFASWKHKMKMHILGHNATIWVVVRIGLKVNTLKMVENRINKHPWMN